MSQDINQLFIILKRLKKMLMNTNEEARKASIIAAELSGEFEQEISTDLDSIQVEIDKVIDDLDAALEEGKTLREDHIELEKKLRAGLDDEENYKINAEHIQEREKKSSDLRTLRREPTNR